MSSYLPILMFLSNQLTNFKFWYMIGSHLELHACNPNKSEKIATKTIENSNRKPEQPPYHFIDKDSVKSFQISAAVSKCHSNRPSKIKPINGRRSMVNFMK